MKKIILTVLCGLLFTVASKAQSDSLRIIKFEGVIEDQQNQINDLYSRLNITTEYHEDEIQDINLRLNSYTKHYFTGVLLVGFGSILTGASIHSYITNPKGSGNGVVLFLGGILTTVGTFKIVLSHSKLKKR
jgi:hypothetical protein